MSFRVNLLNEEEQRREGPIGRKFAIMASAIGGGAVLLLLAVVLVVRSTSSAQKLKQYNQRWVEVEPIHKQLKETQTTVRNRQAVIKELEGWGNSRIPTERLLERLQMLTPEEIQLTRLELRGNYGVERRPANSPDKSPPKVWREYRGMIGGHAYGEKSEDQAVRFVQAITDDSVLAPFFVTVKLQRLQRPTATGRNRPADEDLGHTFSIELASPQRRFE